MAGMENITTLEAWKDALDMQGPSIGIADLKKAIDTAPPEVQETPDYNFFFGLLCGRELERGSL